MITRAQLRLRLLQGYGDTFRTLLGRPSYSSYLKDPLFRRNVAGPTHQSFEAMCWVCGLTAREGEKLNNRLTTAHIVYPADPFTEVIDPRELSRSDVVLLCWTDHQEFDIRTDHTPYENLDALRFESIAELTRMRHDFRGE